MAAFTREFELESQNLVLNLHQNVDGDVSCVVWDAALVLAGFLDCENKRQNGFLKGKSIVELGAGVGCVALTAAALGANAIATDLPAVIPLIEKNVEANTDAILQSGGTCTARVLDWAEKSFDYIQTDYILLADCVYYEQSIEPLISILQMFSDENTTIFLSQEVRDYSFKQIKFWEDFQEMLAKYFRVSKINRERQHPYFYSDDILLLELKLKGNTEN
ncbi:protein N-lysine methyltransferase METTL21D-like [Neocloeon triangulifer]|uniref:protein N-lysine methyltransferase METTL21D-like n=1 Tax=Neocloeon triangulifer TaxID=2078957 RepID=UPI00286F498D|nr:protein N-lysine methyltransferase METTL21D-like [Neocloeon triangulifer]